MRQIDYFDLIFGVLISGIGLLGVFLFREFKAGIAGPVFRPPLIVRLSVGIIMVCVGLAFVYPGLGSPANLSFSYNIGRSILDIFFIVVAAAALIRAGTSLLQRGKQTARLKTLAIAGGLAALCPLAVLDLINRIHN